MMPIPDQAVLDTADASMIQDLKRLCTAHDLEADWIDESADRDQLLGRVRDECERLLSRTELDDAARRRLRDLIRFSTCAASFQEGTATAVAARRRLGEPEREAPTRAGDDSRAERLANMFRELSTLSHQINNPLTSLIGRAQLLRMNGASDERTAKAVRVIEESATRVAGYVRQLALLVKESRDRELG